MTRKPRRSHRPKPTKPTKAQQALHDWLELTMADRVAAHWTYRVIGLHAGLVREIREAEMARVLPQPFRLPGDERVGGVHVAGSVSGTREPDDALFARVHERLEAGGTFDPEGLEPLRQRMAHSLGELAGWYLEHTGPVDLTTEADAAVWEPLAVRLGDLIGDQVAANALATCLICHARLQGGSWDRLRKNAREQWRRRATSFVRWLDQQPDKGRWDRTGRVAVQSVEGEGERRIG